MRAISRIKFVLCSSQMFMACLEESSARSGHGRESGGGNSPGKPELSRFDIDSLLRRLTAHASLTEISHVSARPQWKYWQIYNGTICNDFEIAWNMYMNRRGQRQLSMLCKSTHSFQVVRMHTSLDGWTCPSIQKSPILM